jgi:hypothetical protein
MMTEMAGGVSPDGKRVVSEANLKERRKARVKVDDVTSYGLGLETGTYRDLTMLAHGGGTFGFITQMFMLPEQGIGIVVLTNLSPFGGDLTWAVHRKVLELLFDGRDLAKPRYERTLAERPAAFAAAKKKLVVPADAKWLASLAGTYENDALGPVTIAIGKDGAATIDARVWKSALRQKREDDGTNLLVLAEPPLLGTDLVVAPDGSTLTVQTDQQKYVFTRKK